MSETTYDYSAEFSQVSTPPTIDSGSLAALNSSEIDRQITTAKRYPRDEVQFRKQAYQTIIRDEDTAAGCMFALPRGKEKNPDTGQWRQKIIKGPSIRFAEILANKWKNCRYGSRIISEDGAFITAQGMFYDLENNVAISCEVKRRIVDSEGRRYSTDMVAVTANAACSIALRNAILKAIPQAEWKQLYEAAEKTITGSITTLTDRRDKLMAQFKAFGLTPAMLCQLLDVTGVTGISLDHLSTLAGMLSGLKEGDVTAESLMAEASGQDQSVAAKGRQTIADVKAKYSAPKPADTKAATSPTVEEPVVEPGPEPTPENMDAEPPEVSPELQAAQEKLEAKRKAVAAKTGMKAMTADGMPLKF